MRTLGIKSQRATPGEAAEQGCLAIDVGKSQVRMKLTSDSSDITSFVEPGYHHAACDDGVRGMLAVVRPAISTLPHPPHRCVVAATGLSSDAGDRDRLLRGLVELVGTRRVAVCDDFVAAHAGALGAPGTILIAGTGAIAFSVLPDGTSRRVDGWGPHLGDDGGAYDLGRAGLHAAFAGFDGRGPATALIDRAREYLGGLDFQAAYRLHTRPDAVAVVAGFAPAVAEAASQGDEVARQSLANAVAALARTAAAGVAHCGSPVVSWAGGMFEMGAPLVDPLAAALSSLGARLVAPSAGSLDGAMILCQTESSLYRSMVTATSEWTS